MAGSARRTIRWSMATRTIVSLTGVSASLSRHSRRYWDSHPNVRSSTHRRGITTNPVAPGGRRLTSTAQPQNRFAQATSPACAESAHTSRSPGNRRLPPLSSALAPARSLTLAAVTRTASSRPVVSTSTCRLRPTTLFPPVVPPRAGQRGALDRLAVHHPGGRVGGPAVEAAAVGPQRVVDGGPRPVLLPPAEVPVDGVPRREVAREHPPRAPGPQQVEHRRHDIPAVVLGRAAARLRPGDQVLDVEPLEVRQVRGVALPAHAGH